MGENLPDFFFLNRSRLNLMAARSGLVTGIPRSQIYPCVFTRLCTNSEHYHFNKIRIWTIQVRNNLVTAILFQRLVLLWFHSQTVSPLQTFTSQQNTDTNNLSKMLKIIQEWAYMLLMFTLKFYNNLLLFSPYPRLHFTCVYYLLLFTLYFCVYITSVYSLLLWILYFCVHVTFVYALILFTFHFFVYLNSIYTLLLYILYFRLNFDFFTFWFCLQLTYICALLLFL